MDAIRALMETIANDQPGRARVLLDRDRSLASALDDNGVSMLMLALYYQRRAIADELIMRRGKATLDAFEAAAIGDEDRLREWLDRGVNANSFSPDGYPLLGLAAFFGRVSAAALLLARGADPSVAARNPLRVQPLHSALAHPDPAVAIELAELLLKAGAPVNAVQQRDLTPLHAAAHRGDRDLVLLLLRHGADPMRRASDGRTPADLARAEGHKHLSELLRTTSGAD